MKFSIVDWCPRKSGALFGFATVQFDGYLTVHDVAIMNGKRGLWAGLPCKEWSGKDGKKQYNPVVEFADKDAAFRFSDALCEQLTRRYPDDF